MPQGKCREISTYFDSILDIMSDGIYISDAHGKTCKVNRAYQELTGLKEEELVGRLVTDLKKEGKYDVALNPEIVSTGKSISTVQTTQTGRKVVLNGYPIFNEAGNVVLVVTFVRDVTSLSRLKEQVARQQELIENYQQGVKYFFSKDQHAPDIIAESDEMKKLLATVGNIARTDATVLLLGETGVGKDVFARYVHTLSTRNNAPFFKVDCATIPSNLLESELFGYEGGAFSGASRKGKPGFFEMANKGTLFLDEIGELPIMMQAKLLRVLQDKEILGIGCTKIKKVDTRIIAATNRNLEEAVKEGTFRADLYYRLRVAVITISPLKNRKKDIIPLVDYFINKFSNKYKKEISLSDEVKRLFQEYNWPGNVREMENLIQSLIVTSGKNIIEAVDLPINMASSSVGRIANRSLNEIINEIEADLLKKAYNNHGSVAEVAKYFKVDRSTIFRKMKKYSIL